MLVRILQELGAPDESELDKIKQRQIDNMQRKKYARKIITLFRGDVIDSEEYAKAKTKQIEQNHRGTVTFEPVIQASSNLVDNQLGANRPSETTLMHRYNEADNDETPTLDV